MVKEVYSANELAELKTSKNKHMIICAFLTVLLAVLCFVLCLLVNRENAQNIKITNITLCTAVGWYLLYMLRNYVIPISSEIKQINMCTSMPTERFDGVVTQIGEVITLRRNVKVYPVIVQSESSDVQLYWDANKDIPDFKQRTVSFQTVRHQIVAYEVSL